MSVTTSQNHQQLECLFSSFFKLIWKNTSNLRISCLLWGGSTDGRWIPFTKGQPVMRQTTCPVVVKKNCSFFKIKMPSGFRISNNFWLSQYPLLWYWMHMANYNKKYSNVNNITTKLGSNVDPPCIVDDFAPHILRCPVISNHCTDFRG